MTLEHSALNNHILWTITHTRTFNIQQWTHSTEDTQSHVNSHVKIQQKTYTWIVINTQLLTITNTWKVKIKSAQSLSGPELRQLLSNKHNTFFLLFFLFTPYMVVQTSDCAHVAANCAIRHFKICYTANDNKIKSAWPSHYYLPSDTVMPLDTHSLITSSDPGCSGASVTKATLSKVPYMSSRSRKPFFRSQI